MDKDEEVIVEMVHRGYTVNNKKMKERFDG